MTNSSAAARIPHPLAGETIECRTSACLLGLCYPALRGDELASSRKGGLLLWLVAGIMLTLAGWQAMVHRQESNRNSPVIALQKVAIPPATLEENSSLLALNLLSFGENASTAYERLLAQGMPEDSITAVSNPTDDTFWLQTNLLNPEGFTGVPALMLPETAFLPGQPLPQHWQKKGKVLYISGLAKSFCEHVNTAAGVNGIPALPSLESPLPSVPALCVELGGGAGFSFIRKLEATTEENSRDAETFPAGLEKSQQETGKN